MQLHELIGRVVQNSRTDIEKSIKKRKALSSIKNGHASLDDCIDVCVLTTLFEWHGEKNKSFRQRWADSFISLYTGINQEEQTKKDNIKTICERMEPQVFVKALDALYESGYRISETPCVYDFTEQYYNHTGSDTQRDDFRKWIQYTSCIPNNLKTHFGCVVTKNKTPAFLYKAI